MNERVRVIFSKEVMDSLRDRRSLMSTVLYALLGPVIILLVMVILGNLFRDRIQQTLDLPVSGAENAPALVQYLEQHNVALEPAPADPRQAVRAGAVQMVLVIPPEYGEQFVAGKPAGVQLIVDTSRQSTLPDVARARTLLQNYSGQIGALRLLARGVSPAVVTPLAVESVDVSTPQSQALLFLNMLPYFLVMSAFLGGSVLIDATAGERERGSLEPLLINPVRRWEFVVGKLLASLPFAVATILISLLGFAVTLNVVPVEKFIGFRVGVDVRALGVIFLICLPMVLLAGTIQMVIATFARTYKEAQTYVTWLPLVPALPGMALAFLPVKPAVWAMLVPTYGQQILILQLIRGEVVSVANVAVSIVATLLLSGALIAVAIRLYSREQILFGRK